MRALSKISMAVSLALLAQAAMANEAAASPPPAAPIRLDIEALPLPKAIDRFAQQTGLQVIYHSDELSAGLISTPLAGKFSPQEALRTLLANSGLEFQYLNARTIGLRPVRDVQGEAQKKISATDARTHEHALALAQAADVTTATVPEAHPDDRRADAASGDGSEAPEEVVVTGTHIRGVAPVGSQLITIDREEIDRSGYSTVADIVRALPQNFRGTISDNASSSSNGATREQQTNLSGGTALNLRGLGAGATLVLLDGRRLADSGSEGRFTDISTIPLSAVERIDVLPDSASAIYGSDAVGGVVNIVLRKDYSGAETRLKLGSVTEGRSQEYQLSQMFGGNWDAGHALLSYEYRRREPLLAQDRRQTASADLRALGGRDYRLPFANPGTILDPLTFAPVYAIPHDQDGQSLTPADFTYGTVNYGDVSPQRTLLPLEKRHGLSAMLTQNINDRVSLFFNGLFAQRHSVSTGDGTTSYLFVTDANPYFVNPTGGTDPVYLFYDFIDDLGPQVSSNKVRTLDAAAGGNVELGGQWHLSADLDYAREKASSRSGGFIDQAALDAALSDPDPLTAFNPFGDGSFTNPATLATLSKSIDYAATSELRTANITADGPLWQLAGGMVRAAAGLHYREQSVHSQLTNIFDTVERASIGRHVKAAFAEVSVPLIGADNRHRGIQSLRASIAGRYEQYSDFGSSTNPKLGLEWSPVPGLVVRGNWSTSFKAPNVVDLQEGQNLSAILPLPDPSSPTQSTTVLAWLGGNADLEAETSTTWSAGIEVAPAHLPGLKLDLTYFDIDFRHRIEPGPFVFSVLEDPALAVLVTRNPTAEQAATVCSRSTFSGNTADCLDTALYDAIVDVRTSNTSIVRNNGIDALGSYLVDSSLGRFTFGLNATYLFNSSRALRATSPLLSNLDTPFSPLDFRLRASVVWSGHGLETAVHVNYSDSYRDTLQQPRRSVDSWTTLDLNLAYRPAASARAYLADTSISLNVLNLLDSGPPFLDFPGGYDGANADVLGRFASLTVRKEW